MVMVRQRAVVYVPARKRVLYQCADEAFSLPDNGAGGTRGRLREGDGRRAVLSCGAVVLCAVTPVPGVRQLASVMVIVVAPLVAATVWVLEL